MDNASEENGTRFRFRYFMAVMGSIGLAILYGFKVNASVAIVAMVNHTAIKSHTELSTSNDSETDNATLTSTGICQFDDTSNVTAHTIESEDGPFVWDELTQGLILSSYFWGYMVSMLPGGRLAELWSAKWLMNGSVLLNVAASILTPIAARIHYWLFIAMRFLQGLGGGVSFPAMHVMIAKWAPPNERHVIASIVYAGTALGTVISILLSGLLAANLGWDSIFYIEGLLCLIWCTLWWLLIADSPEEQTRFITQEERHYILMSLGGHKKIPKGVPWAQVFRSKPFIAILIAHYCSNFGWYMLLIELPTFMNQILKFDMSSNAGLSSIPFLCMWLFTLILSKVLAILQEKRLITVTISRKIGTLFASLVPMVCLIQVSHIGCDRTRAVVLMTIAVTCIGGMYSGFLANHIDIAPNFAGSLVAVTNFFATIPGFLVPIFVGQMTRENQTMEAWRMVFLVMIILYIIEILVYTIFGSGNEQPWNQIETPDEEANNQMLPLRRNNTK
ncbi:PREDICTED: putative inorganic phosphate cotransporter isoform X2 [Vollenhovia emeryi]|uniref:putative inorganic phosphate cotransporter isoform X2 n=1 Tax=Vollenhovia emeryi TaxID=411798 RepID=UPI0005F4092A|nr:PREDICTED: putative inorganic phosphate cotransporter isoform X2 [Vollenhovia emeryi]